MAKMELEVLKVELANSNNNNSNQMLVGLRGNMIPSPKTNSSEAHLEFDPGQELLLGQGLANYDHLFIIYESFKCFNR